MLCIGHYLIQSVGGEHILLENKHSTVHLVNLGFYLAMVCRLSSQLSVSTGSRSSLIAIKDIVDC